MKHAVAEIWDGEKSPYRLRIEEIIGDKIELAIDSPEDSLQSAWDHVERLRKQTGDDIWLKGVHRVTLADGTPLVIRPHCYDEETRRNSDNKVRGLGIFACEPGEWQGTKFYRWWYKAPSRPWRQIPGYDKSPVAPPLPKPQSEWHKCGCREREHICGACGKPYWIEFHGVADGYCTYCYYSG